jgi:hypothetical protein
LTEITQTTDLTLLAPQAAPFVYFDGVATYALCAGAVQVELIANILCPSDQGTAVAKSVMTAHLRCSPTAAVALRDALNGVLAMLALAATPAAENTDGRPN